MTWSDFLSVIQLAAGLNAAYFSLSELRTPVFSAEQRSLERLRRFLNEPSNDEVVASDVKLLVKDYLSISIDFNSLYLEYKKADKIMGPFCLAGAVIYTLLLIYAS